MKINKYNASHMTNLKIVTMPVYGKIPLKILLPGSRETITRKFLMKHQGLNPIIVYSNYDTELTLTYFWQCQF